MRERTPSRQEHLDRIMRLITETREKLGDGRKQPTSSSPINWYTWYSRTYLFTDRGFIERMEPHFIPDVFFDRLKCYSMEGNTHRSYETYEAAVSDLTTVLDRMTMVPSFPDDVEDFLLYLSKRFPSISICSRKQAERILSFADVVSMPFGGPEDCGDEKGKIPSRTSHQKVVDKFLLYLSNDSPDKRLPSREYFINLVGEEE